MKDFRKAITPALAIGITLGSSGLAQAAAPPIATAQVSQANRTALREPMASRFTNARQVYAWSEGAVYRLFAVPERVSDVALQPGEKLVSVAAGDTSRWIVGDTTSGSGADTQVHILVKPVEVNLRTNMVIMTDRRSYHVELDSRSAVAMAAISWTYPADSLLAIRQREVVEVTQPIAGAMDPAALNFDYVVSGDTPAWRPLRAFDDGRQTFIEFPASIAEAEAPPLFVVGEDGAAQLVNSRMRGRFYVVDRLFGTAELRLGERRQTVVRVTREAGAEAHARRRP